MNQRSVIFGIILLLGMITVCSAQGPDTLTDDFNILSDVVDPNRQALKFYWKDKHGNNYGNFKNLKSALEKQNKKLVFATNGGMYNKHLSPQGLYIENGITLAPLDTAEKGYGNFYLQPNGIFYLTGDGKAAISTTASFINPGNIQYATQSGPMLLIKGDIHPKFVKHSKNRQIRSGVGILPNGDILFSMSKRKINFYDFASYFKQRGCKNALYLDGFVSRMYIPSKNWKQTDGDFAVIIAVTK
jgi:uncharacterized protein YigE (DUF2233 family)